MQLYSPFLTHKIPIYVFVMCGRLLTGEHGRQRDAGNNDACFSYPYICSAAEIYLKKKLLYLFSIGCI